MRMVRPGQWHGQREQVLVRMQWELVIPVDTMSGHYVEKAIYGLVTVLAVLVAMEEHPPSAWRGAATLFGTTLAVALVETYAATIAATLSRRRALAGEEQGVIWRSVMPVVTGAQAPTIVLLLSALGLFPVGRAITIAQIVVALLRFGYGLRVGQILHQHRLQQLISGLALVAIAGLLVTIKVLFH